MAREARIIAFNSGSKRPRLLLIKGVNQVRQRRRTLMYVAPILSHSFRSTEGGLFLSASTAPLPSRTPPNTSMAKSNVVNAVALSMNSRIQAVPEDS